MTNDWAVATLVVVNSSPRIVVLPIEPVVLQEIDLLQTLPRRRTARRASCKVPRVPLRVEQPPLCILPTALRIAVELDVHSIPLRAERAYRFPVWPGHQHHWNAGNSVLDRSLTPHL